MICILGKNIDYANFVIKTLSIMMISDMPLGQQQKRFFVVMFFPNFVEKIAIRIILSKFATT